MVRRTKHCKRAGAWLPGKVIVLLLSLHAALIPLPLAVQASPAAYRALQLFGGDFTLIDHNEKPYSLHDAQGKIVLLFFGYTSCADICPLTLFHVAEVMRELGPLAEHVQPLFVSVDPQRDTPAVLRAFVKYFHSSIIGLTGAQAAVAAVAHQYRAALYVHKPDVDGSYLVDHGSKLYIIDSGGTLVNMVSYETPSEQITAIVRGIWQSEKNAANH
jgi:cytochrome oxidase Cu insertion factor (SCO1/SenC/PrrC family)